MASNRKFHTRTALASGLRELLKRVALARQKETAWLAPE